MDEFILDFKNRKGLRKLNNFQQMKELIYQYLLIEVTDKKIGINDSVANCMKNLAEEIYVSTLQILGKFEIGLDFIKEHAQNHHRDQAKHPLFFNKTNNYNLNLLSEYNKVKIFIGVNAIIARENFNLSRHYFNDNKYIKSSKVYDCGLYRIEVYPLLHGTMSSHCHDMTGTLYKHDTVGAAVFEKINNLDKNNIEMTSELFLKYIIDVFYDPVTNQGIYPADCNPGNFIITEKLNNYLESKCSVTEAFVCIDWDHLVKTSGDDMIHVVAWMWFSRIFDLDDNSGHMKNDVIEQYRHGRTLFSAIEDFKKEFYMYTNQLHQIEKYGDAFSFEVNDWYLNNSVYLQTIVKEELESRKQHNEL